MNELLPPAAESGCVSKGVAEKKLQIGERG